ncbi:MAG: DNA polymerase IV [Bacteroidales bacterium]|nr:DNA polymerase IV [Bacteroidales bacterium]MCM1147586.1 DNA polymerase IV [Bacteroidales bacterium]MCM1206376.1 DNA polymerase IV [Bacillota bacterium]
MDSYFAAVEQRDNPELKGKPCAVGGLSDRGVLSTASYEARLFGVHSAMSTKRALELCPDLIVVPGDHDKYKRISIQIHDIFHAYTDLIEPISLDEAFLDVTESKNGNIPATDIAHDIKRTIKEQLDLTASAGVSYCKFLAKIASDYNKPDGFYVIHPDKALDFIDSLPIEKFWGVGSITARRMHQLGINCGHQLRQWSLQGLTKEFGKSGKIYYNFARGIDERPVIAERERKSIGCETTFEKDIYKKSAVIIELYHIAEELIRRLTRAGFEGYTLTLKIKYHDFTQITRSHTGSTAFSEMRTILPTAKRLLSDVMFNDERKIRLMGLSVSNPREDLLHKANWIEQELKFQAYSCTR